MAFYGMTDVQLFDMPIKRFWLLNQSIERIEAQRAIRNLTVAAAAQGSATEVRDAFLAEMGAVVIGAAKMDKEGLNSLKQMQVNG